MFDTVVRPSAYLDVVFRSDDVRVDGRYAGTIEECDDSFVPELKLCLAFVWEYIRLARYSGWTEVVFCDLRERLYHTVSVAFGEFRDCIETVCARREEFKDFLIVSIEEGGELFLLLCVELRFEAVGGKGSSSHKNDD